MQQWRFLGEKPKRYACSAMGRLCVRRPGHYCRVRRLRLLRGQAGAPAARNCQSITGTKGIPRRTRDRAARLLCHFVIAFGAAAVYFVASRTIPMLVQHAVVSGVFYGVAVYFFMNRMVVPLSAAAKRPFSLKLMIVGVVIHIFCVGLPISLSVRRFSK